MAHGQELVDAECLTLIRTVCSICQNSTLSLEHPHSRSCYLTCVGWQVMELWTAGMVALMILPRLCLAAVAVVCLMSTREWMHAVVE